MILRKGKREVSFKKEQKAKRNKKKTGEQTKTNKRKKGLRGRGKKDKKE